MANELKPCPFCGGKAKLKHLVSGKFKKMKVFYVECAVCGVRTSVKLEAEETIEAWNRRAEDGSN